ncbi:HNH endonuclease [Luteolibacter sp. LG18]|uniref:HNH endonuclease n=1 Tax=Luteolibacter sp. LG18 TaxID=2819286 RepID=UPI0030C6959B
MSRTEEHGGGSWGFSKCVWAPTRKSNGGKWGPWSKVGLVVKGDTILHLKGIPPEAYFTGYSTAASAGYVTNERPPELGEWGGSQEFYRADLEDYTPFVEPLNLTQIFSERREQLEQFFLANKRNKTSRLGLFYVFQSGKLQCFNGGYFTDMNSDLLRALFGPSLVGLMPMKDPVAQSKVETGSQLRTVMARVGQSEFAREIKKNYGHRCCFPGCEIDDVRFLIGSHIARWADNGDLRGEMGNGLCLCPFHDKAFEVGVFTLDDAFRVRLNPKATGKVADLLSLANEQPLRAGLLAPHLDALREHWKRIGFIPS